MGYNFQLRQVSAFLNTATAPNTIDFSVTVEQIEYTPFYYPLSIAFKCKGAIIQTVPGVEKLIDQYQTDVFTFRNIAIDPSCLSSVQFTLESNSVIPTRPVKWAHGTTGTVIISIPMPPSEITAPVATAIVVPVPTPVSVVVVPVPTTVVVAPVPTPATVVVVTTPVPVPVTTNNNDIRFYLTNADTNTNNDISQFLDNQSFSFASLGTKSLNVRVDAPSTAKSVSFSWKEDNGSRTSREEGTAPWLMGANIGTDYFPVGYLSTVGTKTITVIAKDLCGVAFLTKSVRLVLKD